MSNNKAKSSSQVTEENNTGATSVNTATATASAVEVPVCENHVSNLNEGDEVVLLSGSKKEIKTVTYVGEKNMKVGSYQFSRDTGLGKSLAVGKKIVPVTPELRQEISDAQELTSLREEAEFSVRVFTEKIHTLPLNELKDVLEFIQSVNSKQ